MARSFVDVVGRCFERGGLAREVKAEELRRPPIEFWAARALVGSTRCLDTELVAVDRAGGLVAGDDLLVTRAVPGYESSAMDGYALRPPIVQTGMPEGTRLSVVGSIYAGGGMTRWRRGAAVKVMTGGRIPVGADCVVPSEETDLGVEEVIVWSPVTSGRNVRRVDAEIAPGQQLLRAGAIVTSRALSALVASGIGTVSVVRQPRVAILTTGDELVTAGAGLGDGQVIDSNGPFLKAFIEANGAEVVAVGRVGERWATSSGRWRRPSARWSALWRGD